jgi:dihydroflavonol-4-reductase
LRILVTGATGFVGSVLLPKLVERHGASGLRCLVLPGEMPGTDNHWRSVEVCRGDITDAAAVAVAVRGCEVVLHLAGLISYRQSDRARLFRINAEGAAKVAGACARAGVRRLVHVSSTGATGFCREGGPATASTPFNWPSAFHYMTSKREGQESVRRIAAASGLEVVTVIPAAIMGPGDANPTTPHNRLYALVRSSPVLPTFTGGTSIVDVRDVADAILRGIDAKVEPEPFLLAGANRRYSDVLRQIAAGMGRRVRLVSVPAPIAAGAGFLFEAARVSSAPITYAYGLMSGWRCYHDGSHGRLLLGHQYRSFDATILDDCRFFSERHVAAR